MMSMIKCQEFEVSLWEYFLNCTVFHFKNIFIQFTSQYSFEAAIILFICKTQMSQMFGKCNSRQTKDNQITRFAFVAVPCFK